MRKIASQKVRTLITTKNTWGSKESYVYIQNICQKKWYKNCKELTLFFPDPGAGYSAEGFLALSFDPSLVSLIIRAAANAMIYIIFFWFFLDKSQNIN